MKNDGSIVCRGKDKQGKAIWEVRISAGIDPETGKYRVKGARVHGTKAEAKAKRDEMRNELESGLRFDADRVTLRDFCTDYINARRATANVLPETLDTNERQLADICDIMGNIALKDVTPMMVQNLYLKLKKRVKARNAGKCSGSTLHSYHVTLKAALKYAVNHDLLIRNPCDRVEAPKVDKPNRRALTVEEAARLLSCLDGFIAKSYTDMDAKENRRRDPEAPRMRVEGLPTLSAALAARLILATGMRLGEALALKWSDIDFRASSLHVRRGLAKTDRVKDTPKTDSSNRMIALDAATVAHLAKWSNEQAVLLESIGVAPEWVFCTREGTYLQHSTYNRWWQPFKKEHGFEGLRTHELRHTQATLLLANGTDVKTVQHRMGHANAAITLNWYAHPSEENDREAANLFAGMVATGEKPRREARIIEMKTA